MKTLLAIVLVAMVGGCQSIVPSTTYVQADRATKTAVEPMLNVTAKDHPELAQPVADVLASWELRLKNAEQTAQPATQPAK